MNSTTTFLLQLIGPIGLIIGISLWINPKFYKNLIKSMEKEPIGLYIASLGAMTIGLSIILKHNLWTTTPEIIISLLGWILFLKGILLAFSPIQMYKISKKLVKSSFIVWGGTFWIILGAYMCWLGFFA